MNKQTVSQINFFLSGLLSRISENPEYFESINVTFNSGLKNFSLKASMEENILIFNFGGNKYKLNFDGFSKFISEQAPEYDSMTLSYLERGKEIIIRAKDKSVTTETKSRNAEIKDMQDVSLAGDREYLIKPAYASKLLSTIGILGQNGKIRNDRIRKYNQIDYFVELLSPMLLKLFESKNSINIVDCACGKSYLSFVLNYYICEVLGKKCNITGLDYNGHVISQSKEMAKELNYKNMDFVETDICIYEPKVKYDLLLTLHACDTATDKALNFALRNNIPSIACVPCCHKELNSQYSIKEFEPIMKYGILKARIADSLTDGLRCLYLESCGYDVSIVEYISPLDTPKNLLIRATKNPQAKEDKTAFYRLCGFLGADLSIGKY